ncbi:AAA family ATPase [Sandaracinus amylolyticus]|uniref:AAA family ATPase n=1 Tax=Sandaracinus amylolyticus TaxID=927083 RepID=UPI001F44CD2F|nr:AAA family ATPase [Sandaracinus amylolyticus]
MWIARAPDSIARIEHELGLRDQLELEWAARPHAIVQRDGRPTLELDDPGGRLLATAIGRAWDVESFLRVAIGISTAVARMHGKGLVHRALTPASVLIDATTGRAWMMGFGVADASAVPSALAYGSPEQTGRMGRAVDARSDLYSLGVTLYQMLSGHLPFVASEPLEWIHCHLARAPAPLDAERVPKGLAAVVMKLLAKSPDDRYQTAAGLEADLRACARAWHATGRIDSFALGTDDAPVRLAIPDQLYGREHELGVLLDAWDRVSATGRSELVLVAGHSGVGKSSLVSELRRTAGDRPGLFASGKHDQYKRDVPYATLAQALRALVRPLLQEREAELETWRRRLLDALEGDGGLVAQLAPELEHVIGRLPSIDEIPAQHVRARFQRRVRSFLGAFAQPREPLMLFLDDLQWLDAATLDLLESLFVDRGASHLLVIGAYRDNEIDREHDLHAVLARIRASEARVTEIDLGPLSLDDTNRLFAASLRTTVDETRPLAEVAHARTEGNPFFAMQFLDDLVDCNEIERANGRWSWSLDRIRARELPDGVAELMVSRASRLEPAARQVLTRLACLGTSASITDLAWVTDTAPGAVAAALDPAVSLGFVARDGEGFRFLHDRVQEACYALVPEAERPALHLEIGRRLARGDRADAVFDIAGQLDRAHTCIVDRDERDRAAELSLRAGRRAMAAAAFGGARAHFAAGDRFLDGDDRWSRAPSLAFAIGLGLAECEYLTGENARSDARFAELATRATSLVERAAVTCRHVHALVTVGQIDRAIDLGVEHLRAAGLAWTEDPTADECRRAYEKVWATLGARTIEDLADLPAMTDATWRGTMEVLVSLHGPALYANRPRLHSMIGCSMVSATLEHGVADSSGVGYLILAMHARQSFGDDGIALRLGQAALRVVERPGTERYVPQVLVGYASVVHAWTRPMRECRVNLVRGLAEAHRIGDTAIGGSGFQLVSNYLAAGDPLHETRARAITHLEIARELRAPASVGIVDAQLRLVDSLRGADDRFPRLFAGEEDEIEYEAALAEGRAIPIVACWYWIRKLVARVIAGDHASAVDAARKADALLWVSPSNVDFGEHRFYAALAYAGALDERSDAREDHVATLRAYEREIAGWADDSPANHGSRAALVSAELARLEGRSADAEVLYERAIALAQEHALPQVEALAHERAARHCARRALGTMARAYLREARAAYARWGAAAKVAAMDAAGLGPDRPVAVATATLEHQLDLTTILDASRALSSEIVLDELIRRIMTLALEQAGATRGVLVLASSGTLRIRADATADRTGIAVRPRDASPTELELPQAILRFVARSKESVILSDTAVVNEFSSDPYLQHGRVRSLLCMPLLKQGVLTGIVHLENELTPDALTPARIEVLHLLGSQAAISLENARLYDELQQSDSYLTEAQRLSRTGSFGWNAANGELVWSPETFRIFGVDAAVRPTLDVALERVHPDDRAAVAEKLDRVAGEGIGHWELEHRVRMPDGAVKHVRVVAKTAGPSDRFVGAVMDVTAAEEAASTLRTALEEKDALLKEVHHRVKNNMQLVSSLLSLQASRCDPAVARALAESQHRVRAMALVHENLYVSGNLARIQMGSHVARLCWQLKRAFGVRAEHVTLDLDVSDLELEMDSAVSCGLVINELVSNAMKYAFPAGRRGTVRIALHARGREHTLIVEDDGIGLPPSLENTAETGTLGLQLVHDLVDQMRATMTIARHEGTRFVIVFEPPSDG